MRLLERLTLCNAASLFSAGTAFVRHPPAMRLVPSLALLSILILPAAAHAEEDAAHRADRLRTEQLNRNAAAVVARRDRQNAQVRKGGDDAMDRYQKQLAAWRRRVADCRAGDYSACDR